MARQFNPSAWVDGVTVPHASDFQDIAADIATMGGPVDGSSYPISNLGFVQLNPGAVTGTDYTVTGASWSGGVATFTVGAHALQIGQLVSVTGASPAGWNVSQVPVTAITGTAFSVGIAANPGAWTSGGTAQADGTPAANGTLKVDQNGNAKLYGAALVSNWSRLVGAVDTLVETSQAANIGSTALLALGVSGSYRLSIAISVTQPATSSCTLPSVSIGYTHADSSAAISVTPIATSSTNSTANVQQATVVCPAKAGSNITFQTSGYASSGATPMQYSLRITVEYLG